MNCRDPTATSECDATVGNCGGFGHGPNVANYPLGLSSDSGIGDVEFLQRRQHQDWVTHKNVTVVHVPLIR